MAGERIDLYSKNVWSSAESIAGSNLVELLLFGDIDALIHYGNVIIRSGMSMCKIHHAAYDCNILAVRPDYTIEIRGDILEESDGPMLKHGLQGLHNASIILPNKSSLYPDRNRLEERYALCKTAV